MDLHELLVNWHGGDRKQRAQAVVGERLAPLLAATGVQGDTLVALTEELCTGIVTDLDARGLLA